MCTKKFLVPTCVSVKVTKMHTIISVTLCNDNSYGSGNIIPFCVLYICLIRLPPTHPVTLINFFAMIKENNDIICRK